MGCSPVKITVTKKQGRRQSVLDLPNNPIALHPVKSNIKGFLVLEEKEDPMNIYNNLEFLKQTKHGSIFKVQHKRNKNIRLMKTIQLSEEEEHSFTKEDLINQTELLRNFNHPNIIRLFEIFSFNHKIYMIYEFCPRGDLLEFITKNSFLSEQQCKDIIHQVLCALNYCNIRGVTHNDLCPEHLVIMRSNSISMWIKIIDFGAFNLIGKGKKVLTSGFKNCSNFLFSPIDEVPSDKGDIWSVGVIAYFIMTGELPFYAKTWEDLRHVIQSTKGKIKFEGSAWNFITPTARNFIQLLLQLNSDERPSASEALKHPWFEGLQDNNDKFMNSEGFKKVIKNLKNNSSKNKIKDGLVFFVLYQVAKSEDMDLLRKSFCCLDLDNDGMISREELKEGLEKISSKEQAEEDTELIFSNSDNKEDNYIKYEDFIKSSINKDEILTDKNLKLVFELMDKEHKGIISKSDLKEFFLANDNFETKNCTNNNVIEVEGSLGQAETKEDDIFAQFISEVDKNNDGFVNFVEFKKLMVTCK